MRAIALSAAGVLLALCIFPASAFELQTIDVAHADDRYRVSMRVTLDAPAAAVYAVFTDVQRLPQINSSVREVRVLEEFADGMRRVFTQVQVCVAYYCRQLRQVQDMHFDARAEDGGNVRATVIPERSDFRYGEASWSLRNCEGRTCLSFDAELEPAFWVPPLIGPWLIQRKLRAEAMETSEGLERLARADLAKAH